MSSAGGEGTGTGQSAASVAGPQEALGSTMPGAWRDGMDRTPPPGGLAKSEKLLWTRCQAL